MPKRKVAAYFEAKGQVLENLRKFFGFKSDQKVIIPANRKARRIHMKTKSLGYLPAPVIQPIRRSPEKQALKEARRALR